MAYCALEDEFSEGLLLIFLKTCFRFSRHVCNLRTLGYFETILGVPELGHWFCVLRGNMLLRGMCMQEKEEEKIREEMAKQGIRVPKKAHSETFDSNTITPGTPFMHRLSVALQYYVHLRLNNDPGWRNIIVRSLLHVPQCDFLMHFFWFGWLWQLLGIDSSWDLCVNALRLVWWMGRCGKKWYNASMPYHATLHGGWRGSLQQHAAGGLCQGVSLLVQLKTTRMVQALFLSRDRHQPGRLWGIGNVAPGAQ